MTVKLGMLLLGSLLIYAGWTNRDVRALLLGDNTVSKGSSPWASTSGGSAAPTGTNSAGAGASSSPPPAPAANPPQAGKQMTKATPNSTIRLPAFGW